MILYTYIPQKFQKIHRLGSQNSPRSLGLKNLENKTAKMKIVTSKMKIVHDPDGRGGWPLIST
jgi:hypothetical protein